MICVYLNNFENQHCFLNVFKIFFSIGVHLRFYGVYTKKNSKSEVHYDIPVFNEKKCFWSIHRCM